jgi:hypothetical protein
MTVRFPLPLEAVTEPPVGEPSHPDSIETPAAT